MKHQDRLHIQLYLEHDFSIRQFHAAHNEEASGCD